MYMKARKKITATIRTGANENPTRSHKGKGVTKYPTVTISIFGSRKIKTH